MVKLLIHVGVSNSSINVIRVNFGHTKMEDTKLGIQVGEANLHRVNFQGHPLEAGKNQYFGNKIVRKIVTVNKIYKQ